MVTYSNCVMKIYKSIDLDCRQQAEFANSKQTSQHVMTELGCCCFLLQQLEILVESICVHLDLQ